MIVKIENLEQEKHVLECAEKDGIYWSSYKKATSMSPNAYYGEEFPYELEISDVLTYNNSRFNGESPTTFEQFKAQREQSEFVKQSDELTRQNDLEKENEELKNKLGEIEKWGNTQRTNKGITTYEEGWRDFGIALISIFFQTPSQTEANEIIKNSSTEVLEELKKLL